MSWIRSGIALALFAASASVAQALDVGRAASQLLRDRWDSNNGLPVQATTALLQDARGYLWIGTQEGLARFDGARFTAYGSHNSKAFRSDIVHALAQTPDGAVWVGTHEGIVRIEGEAQEIFSTAQGLPSQVVTAAAVAGDGTLWVGTGGGGVARYRERRFEAVGPARLDVRALVAGPGGAVWFGTSGAGVFRIDAAGAAPTVTPIAGTAALADATVAALAIDPAGTVWVGTARGGLFTLRDGALAPARLGPRLERVDVASLLWDRTGTLWIGTQGSRLWRVRGLPAAAAVEEIETPDTVSAVLEDRAGDIWFATLAGGLGRLGSPLFTTVGAGEGLSNAAALAVLQDRAGQIWVGTLSGLNRLTSDHSAVPVAPEVLGKATILALFEDHEGALWVGARTGLYKCRGGACAAEDAAGVKEDVQSFAEDAAAGVMWIGTGRGLVRKTRDGSTLLTTSAGLPNDRVSLLFRDAAGVLWVGTEAGGVARYEDGQFRRLVSDDYPELAGTWALSARQDEDGSVWFGTTAGVARVQGDSVGLVRHQQGLACAAAFSILPGSGDDLWMSCMRGVGRVRRADLLAVALGRQATLAATLYRGHPFGLEGEPVGSVSPAAIRGSDGRLWFATLQGLVFVDPGHEGTAAPPPVIVESLQVEEGAPVAPGRALSFPPGTRHVDIAYTAVELARHDQLRFRYRLDGVDDTWTNAGGRRLALYPNLGPGRYTFRVESALEGGGFGGAAPPVEFEIRPFFYETRAFQVALVALAVALVFGGYRLRERGFAARRRELEEIVDRRTAELQSSVEEQRRMAERMRTMAEEMHERSLRDPLTGLRNRRFLSELLDIVTRAAPADARGQETASHRDDTANTGVGVVLIDIDHFKHVNDRYGHEAGDDVLRQFAQRAAGAIRPADVAVRWGGEEFLVALTATNPQHLSLFVERLRAVLSAEPFLLAEGTPVRMTCSAGYAALPFAFDDGPAATVMDLIGLADLALIAAKRGGRDRSMGAVAGRRGGVTEEMLRKAMGNMDYAVREGIVELVTSRPPLPSSL